LVAAQGCKHHPEGSALLEAALILRVTNCAACLWSECMLPPMVFVHSPVCVLGLLFYLLLCNYSAATVRTAACFCSRTQLLLQLALKLLGF
jgi:hypothetical protein